MNDTTRADHNRASVGRANRPRRRSCRHDFRFAEIRPNVFRLLLPEEFTELHASDSVAVYTCKNCNAFLLRPIGRDMPDMEGVA